MRIGFDIIFHNLTYILAELTLVESCCNPIGTLLFFIFLTKLHGLTLQYYDIEFLAGQYLYSINHLIREKHSAYAAIFQITSTF